MKSLFLLTGPKVLFIDIFLDLDFMTTPLVVKSFNFDLLYQ